MDLGIWGQIWEFLKIPRVDLGIWGRPLIFGHFFQNPPRQVPPVQPRPFVPFDVVREKTPYLVQKWAKKGQKRPF